MKHRAIKIGGLMRKTAEWVSTEYEARHFKFTDSNSLQSSHLHRKSLTYFKEDLHCEANKQIAEYISKPIEGDKEGLLKCHTAQGVAFQDVDFCKSRGQQRGA
jgi:hypothetical protein